MYCDASGDPRKSAGVPRIVVLTGMFGQSSEYRDRSGAPYYMSVICLLCGGSLRVISDVTGPAIIDKILSHVRQIRAPPERGSATNQEIPWYGWYETPPPPRGNAKLLGFRQFQTLPISYQSPRNGLASGPNGSLTQ
jgi:hypothetical protein